MIGRLSVLFEWEHDDVVLALPEGTRLRFVASPSPLRADGEWTVGEGTVRLRWGPRPLYLHLDDGRVLGPRRLPLGGAMNFRDLGGYAGLDGRLVRWGRIYRADHLGALSAADRALLDAHGIVRAIDFRSDVERAEHGHLDHPTCPVRRLPIVEELAEQVTPLDAILRGDLTSWSAADMAEMYRRMLRQWPEVFAAVITAAAEEDGGALVFHCTAGKDRTGVAAALILGLLGVSDEDILDDYELTNRYRSRRRLEEIRPRFEAAGIDLEPLMAFFIPPREAMAATLAHLREDHGGVERWALEQGRLPAATVAALRRTLLTT